MASGRITQKARAAAYRQLTAPANGRAADLLPVIEELTAAGITSRRGIAAGLDERGISTASCGAELHAQGVRAHPLHHGNAVHTDLVRIAEVEDVLDRLHDGRIPAARSVAAIASISSFAAVALGPSSTPLKAKQRAAVLPDLDQRIVEPWSIRLPS
jgi:hypothetical protein